MKSQDKVSKLEQKTFRFYGQDGLLEIFGGLMLAVSSILMSRPYTIYLVISFSLVVGPWLLKKLKQKITNPRIGYYAAKDDNKAKFDRNGLFYILGVLAVWVLIILLAGGLNYRTIWFRWTPTLLALLLFGPFIYIVARSGQKAYYLLAVVSLAGAVALAFFDFHQEYVWGVIYSLSMGATLIIIGAAKMVHFLVKYPRVEMEVKNNAVG
jgi:hypothetical protein